MEKSNSLKRPSAEDIYLQKFPKKSFLGSIVLVFFISLIYTLPIEHSLKTFLSNQIYSVKQCPMDFRDVEFSLFFFPKVDIKDLTINGVCFNRNLSGTSFENIRFSFLGPSISPLGAKVKVDTKEKGINLNIYANLGPKEQKIKIENTGINTSFISKFAGKELPITGRLLVDGLFDISKNQLSSGSLKVTSQNLMLPKQTFNNVLELPQMKLGPLILSGKVTTKGKTKTLKIMQVILGDDTSDIELELDGDIEINQFNASMSIANLKGKIKLSEKVNEAIPLLKIYLGGKKPTNGFYQFEFKGPLNKTKPKFL